MALPVAVIGFQLLRQALIGVGKKGASATIARKFGVSDSFAKKIAKQYYSVVDKGKNTVKVGRGKQEIVSDAGNIRVSASQANVDKINKFKSSPEGQKLYKESLNVTGKPPGVASAEGKGLLSTTNEQVRRGAGFLRDNPVATGAGATAIGAGFLSSGDDEGEFDSRTVEGTDRRLRDESGNLIYEIKNADGQVVGTQITDLTDTQREQGFTANTIGAEGIEAPTLSEYNEFKNSITAYNRRREDLSLVDRLSPSIDDPNNPINLEKNQRFMSIYENDPDNVFRNRMTNDALVSSVEAAQEAWDANNLPNETPDKKVERLGMRPTIELAKDAKFNAQMNMMGMGETDALARQKSSAAEGFSSLREAQAIIQSGAAFSGVETEGDSKKYPGYALLGAEDDRNVLERTFNVGPEPKYVRKVFDANSNTFIVPTKDDPRYELFTEDEIVSGKRNVVVPGSDVSVGPAAPNYATETTLNPEVRTVKSDGTVVSAATDKPQNVPLMQDTQKLFGLANYLSQMSQNRGAFMGQQMQPQGFFDNRTPMQQFYGSRPLGFFDPEFYNNLGLFK